MTIDGNTDGVIVAPVGDRVDRARLDKLVLVSGQDQEIEIIGMAGSENNLLFSAGHPLDFDLILIVQPGIGTHITVLLYGIDAILLAIELADMRSKDRASIHFVDLFKLEFTKTSLIQRLRAAARRSGYER